MFQTNPKIDKPMLFTRMLLFVIGIFFVLPGYACTIFVLTDSKRTLFFNNEDYSNPATRVWFVPAAKGYYGVAYVGFDNDWEQGGVNTAGLAFDWVAGAKEVYTPDPGLRKVRGNSSERMLESCATVEEAIAFYQQYEETAFSYARILIADKTGASVIIGARNGKMYFDRSTQSRGFGYGSKALSEHLAKSPEPTLESGLPILKACKQEGQYATKYASVYDLRSGDMYLVSSGDEQKAVKLNLASELAKGGHYYDIPQLDNQLKQAPLALLPGMKRFIYDGYPPVGEADPVMDQKFATIDDDFTNETLKAENFSPELWKHIAGRLKEIRKECKKVGKRESIALLERKVTDQQKSYLYRVEYENATVLQRLVFNDQNQLTVAKAEGWEWKPHYSGNQ